jgi:hypothetical protein
MFPARVNPVWICDRVSRSGVHAIQGFAQGLNELTTMVQIGIPLAGVVVARVFLIQLEPVRRILVQQAVQLPREPDGFLDLTGFYIPHSRETRFC